MLRWTTFFLLTAVTTVAHSQQDSLLSCRQLREAQARLACYDRLADQLGANSTPAPTLTAQHNPAPAVANFGLPPSVRKDEVEAVQSSVGAGFSGWGPNQRIHLLNGQVWQVVDGSSVALPVGARKVTVKRGALGSFYLDFEGLNSSPRVRRVE